MTQDEAKLKEKIEQLHSNDPMQLKAIYSNSKRLLIEAPAGYGKTKTMISKIAYLLVTKKLSSNKKILALSFSVNAAYKIKKDVTSQLPQLIGALDFNINDKLFISNYHGLCRRILKYYGYLLHQNLREIDNLTSINDDDYQELMSLKVGLRHEEAELLTKISDSVKNINNANYKFLLDNWDDYIQIVCKKLITNKYIPYNAILMFVVQLLKSYTEIKSFYQKYFEIIIVDEFQDTNILSFLVLDQLIGEDNQVVFIGDSLQRIYGFIGAIPNLLEKCRKRYKMDKITLSQNYRFKDNSQMLLLEKNIRANAENLSKPSISQNALIPLVVLDNQEEEAIWVANKVIELKEEKESNRIAILSRSRGKNIDVIINKFKENKIKYFYGLYTDEDPIYIDFHKRCQSKFIEFLQSEKNITKTFIKKYLKEIEDTYSKSSSIMIESLLQLLSIFLNRISEEFMSLHNEDKINLIQETFNNYALKQNMEFVNENVVISTMHAAKGLEWDYVILPDMEQNVFPSYRGFCSRCNFKLNTVSGFLCHPNFGHFNKKDESKYLEELSVFYVAITRAKKQVFFSASRSRLNSSGEEKNSKLSCFLSLSGLVLKEL